MTRETPQTTLSAAACAQEPLRSRSDLNAQLEQIERLLQKGELQRGAYLLNDLIGQMRAHHRQGQSGAQGTGAAPDDEERLTHDHLIERARRLKTRCLNVPANTDLRHAIETDLVVLMGDLMQSDLCSASRAADSSDDSQ